MLVFVNLELLLLVTHPSEFVIDIFVLLLAEHVGFVIPHKLVGDSTLPLFFGEPLVGGSTLIINNLSDLEVLRQLLRIIRLIKPLGIDEVPELNGPKVSFDLVSKFNLRHLSPPFSSSEFLLLLPVFLL